MSQEIAVYQAPRTLVSINANARRCLPNPNAAERFFEFFTANIRNRNTRRAYYKALCRFAAWCEGLTVCAIAP